MVNIIVNSDSRFSINKLAIQAIVSQILGHHGLNSNVELGISIVGDQQMHQINKKHRGIDSSTNILSFALEDPVSASQLQHVPKMGFAKAPDLVLRLGDVVISYPQVVKDASLEGVSVEEELLFLVEHGTKHLLGLHHD